MESIDKNLIIIRYELRTGTTDNEIEPFQNVSLRPY